MYYIKKNGQVKKSQGKVNSNFENKKKGKNIYYLIKFSSGQATSISTVRK